MRNAMGVIGASMIALVLVSGCDTSSRSSPTPASSTTVVEHNACWSAVDELSNEISAATNSADIRAAIVLASFRACGEAGSWKKYADIDKVASEIGGLGDTSGPFTASSALALLCRQFDKSSSSNVCKLS